ncbi:MAG: trypsin-like peptidase domain-containing protein [Rhodobacteraceae bacterium]|nr:trypsin-like peptidase domain-containing protein [Paracoccaceae bacterium]
MILRWVLFVAVLFATPLAAQTTTLRKLDTANSASVWKAVGRIQLGTSGFCSGTLIAADLVLTAAHCLYKGNSGATYAPTEITFQAGFRNGKAVTERRAIAAEPHSGFDPRAPLTDQNVSVDVALIQLDQPISTFDIPPFYVSRDAVRQGPVSVVSYGRGRSNVQSRQDQCQMFRQLGDVLLFDCDVTFGSSGAPVFTHLNGRGQIMSVISGMASYQSKRVALGMQLPERVEEVKKQLRVNRVAPKATIKRITVGGNRSGSGAKFVRP